MVAIRVGGARLHSRTANLFLHVSFPVLIVPQPALARAVARSARHVSLFEILSLEQVKQHLTH